MFFFIKTLMNVDQIYSYLLKTVIGSNNNYNKKNYNMKYHVILLRFKWLINVSPSLEGIRYPRSVYVLSFVCFFLLLLLFLYSLEKQFGWFLTHISRLHI